MGILPDWMIEKAKAIFPFLPGIKRPGKISYGVSSYGYDARIGFKFKIFTPALCAEVDPKNFDENAFVSVDLSPREGHVYKKDSRYPDGEDPNCIYCGCHKQNQYKEEWREDCRWYVNTIAHDFENADDDDEGNVQRPKRQNFIRIPPNSFVLGETVEEFDIPRDCLAIVLGKSTYARCGLIVNVTPLEPEWKGKVTVEISNTTPLPARVYAGEGIMQVLLFRTDGVNTAVVDALKTLLSGNHAGPLSLEMAKESLIQLLDLSSCRTSYADKGGKYQNQAGLVLPTVDKDESKS